MNSFITQMHNDALPLQILHKIFSHDERWNSTAAVRIEELIELFMGFELLFRVP